MSLHKLTQHAARKRVETTRDGEHNGHLAESLGDLLMLSADVPTEGSILDPGATLNSR